MDMTEILYSLLTWIGIFLLIRVNRTGHYIGSERESSPNFIDKSDGSRRENSRILTVTDVDPACGKTVTPERAKSCIYRGVVYYFCSRECREVFEAAPDLYFGDRRINSPELKHSHG